MEYNLKNKPLQNPDAPKAYFKEAVKWFEGFEKELRELLDKYRFSGEFYQGVIKEILGETP